MSDNRKAVKIIHSYHICFFFCSQEHLSYFHFVGRVIGMAIFHSHYLDGGFTMPFYKQLLGKQVTLDDLESVDPHLHRSLCWMLWVLVSLVMSEDWFGNQLWNGASLGSTFCPWPIFCRTRWFLRWVQRGIITPWFLQIIDICQHDSLELCLFV